MNKRYSIWTNTKTNKRAELYYHKPRTGRCALRDMENNKVIWRGKLQDLNNSSWKEIIEQE